MAVDHDVTKIMNGELTVDVTRIHEWSVDHDVTIPMTSQLIMIMM